MKYCADHFDHTVRKLTTEGVLLMTLGDSENPADTGLELDHSPVGRSTGPFNMVTNAAVGPDGDLFVSDGYGNSRVHRCSAEGELKASWGEPGSDPGEFNLPHSIVVDRSGRVFVSGRENSRIDDVMVHHHRGVQRAPRRISHPQTDPRLARARRTCARSPYEARAAPNLARRLIGRHGSVAAPGSGALSHGAPAVTTRGG